MSKRPKRTSELLAEQIDYLWELSVDVKMNGSPDQAQQIIKLMTDLKIKHDQALERERETVSRKELMEVANGMGDTIHEVLESNVDEEVAHILTDRMVSKFQELIQ